MCVTEVQDNRRECFVFFIGSAVVIVTSPVRGFNFGVCFGIAVPYFFSLLFSPFSEEVDFGRIE